MNLWDTVDLSSSTFENLSKICSVHHKAGDICISTFTCPPTLAWRAPAREMENISGGPTFGDFVTIRTEASMQDITVARLQSTNSPVPPLRVSLWTVKIFLAHHQRQGGRGKSLYISGPCQGGPQPEFCVRRW